MWMGHVISSPGELEVEVLFETIMVCGWPDSYITLALAAPSSLKLGLCYQAFSLRLIGVTLLLFLNPTLLRRSMALEHPLHIILESIRKCLDQIHQVKVVHTYREGNYCADMLAKLAIMEPLGMHMLDEPPAAVLGLLEADYFGFARSRLCTLQAPG